LQRGFERDWQRWQEELLQWRVRQIVVTAELLDKPWQDVDYIDMAFCRAEHGRPEPESSAPKMRTDHRYGRRRRRS
jgi:hypothetical protein